MTPPCVDSRLPTYSRATSNIRFALAWSGLLGYSSILRSEETALASVFSACTTYASDSRSKRMNQAYARIGKGVHFGSGC